MNFQILDDSNTARLTMADPRPSAAMTQVVDAMADARAIYQAVGFFAANRGIPRRMVQLSIVWPAKRVAA